MYRFSVRTFDLSYLRNLFAASPPPKYPLGYVSVYGTLNMWDLSHKPPTVDPVPVPLAERVTSLAPTVTDVPDAEPVAVRMNEMYAVSDDVPYPEPIEVLITT